MRNVTGSCWTGNIQRIENGKVLVEITELSLSRDLVRVCNPPILAWVPVDQCDILDNI